MKKNYLFTLILTLCFSVLSFGQGAEPFTKSNATSSYADGSFVGENDITWTYVESRDADGTATNVTSLTTKALLLRRSSDDSKITSSTISGGIGDFSVKLYKGFTGGGNRQVELFINGVSRGTSTPFDNFDEHIFTVSGINVTGDIVIELKNITSKQIIIDDITWTAPSSEPTLSIITPTDNQVFDASVTEIIPTISIANFTLSADNGSGMGDNSGDGYINLFLQETGKADVNESIFSTTIEKIDLIPGNSYALSLELVDNSGNSLDPAVSSSITFSVEFPCDLSLGEIDTSCDALTSGTDTFSGSIDFTGGNTGVTYTITAPQGVTVGGDDPNSIAEGTITFSGMTEGIDADITIVGGDGSSCDFTRTLYSPTCISLPIYEPFDYAADTDLIAQSNWQNASDSSDEVKVVESDGGGFLILDSYYGQNELPDFTGNMVSFSGIGSDPYIGFSDVTSGVVYASFTFHVSDMANFSNTNGGYFAVLTENSDFKSRLWLRDPNAGTQDAGFVYNLGLSTGSTATMYNDFTANLAEPVFVVIGYDLDNDETKMWVVPDASSFGTSTPPDANLTISSADAGSINRFLIRQDSSSETPSIDFDELRLGTSWADVTSNPTASVNNNSIEGFATYPNPVTNNQFTITSNSLDTKKVAIFNVIGKKVFTTSVAGTKSIIDVSSISSGLYILKVTEGNKIATSKLVIE